MIVTSLLLILAAVAMLVLGLVSGSSQLLVGSIAASLLAAIALVIGAWQSAASRARTDYLDRVGGEPDAGPADPARAPARERVAAGAPGRPYDRTVAEAPTESFPAVAPPTGMPDPEPAPPPMGSPASLAPPPLLDVLGQPMAGTDPLDDAIDDEEDPPDEPVRQLVSAADAARVARMSTPVMVVDGRPRYHLPGCVHLLGRDSEPLPVAEAVELGFTPCSLCEPTTSLLADARWPPDVVAADAGPVTVAVRVRPGASRTTVGGRYDGPWGPALGVAVHAPAVEGRATEAARRALAKALGVRPAHLTLRAGATSRDKLFVVDPPPAGLAERVRELRDGP